MKRRHSRVCVVTAGHLATCPRMVKAADALAQEGHAVRVVSTRHVPWATEADRAMRRTRDWRWSVVDYSPANRRLWLQSALRSRAAETAVTCLGSRRVPLPVAMRAYSRVHDELVDAAVAEPCDLFYGGTTGALAAIAEAARRQRVRFGLDLEDFHSAEQADPDRRWMDMVAARIETEVLPRAAFTTAAGAAMAREYAAKYDVQPVSIDNTFRLPPAIPAFDARRRGPLRLYWFSQTVGATRGLEECLAAVALAGVDAELHLRGQVAPGYADGLRKQIRAGCPSLQLTIHDPAPPDEMIDLARAYDIGLAVEQPLTRSRELCLTNKIFTYMLAGLAIVATDTPGQHALTLELGSGALAYAPGDVRCLADGLQKWARDREALACAKRASWAAASRRWHWDHPAERGALVDAVAAALS